MKLQTIACAVAIATGGLFFSHTMNEARAATNTAAVSQSIQPTQEQALVARQLATFSRPPTLFKYASGCEHI